MGQRGLEGKSNKIVDKMDKNKILSQRRPFQCNLCKILRDIMHKEHLGDYANEFPDNKDSIQSHPGNIFLPP